MKQTVKLERSLNWWNLETADGYIMASYDHTMKEWARLYQKIARRTMLTDGNVTKAVRAQMLRSCSHANVGTTDNPQVYACMDCGISVARQI